jgi:hypothetical protein
VSGVKTFDYLDAPLTLTLTVFSRRTVILNQQNLHYQDRFRIDDENIISKPHFF